MKLRGRVAVVAALVLLGSAALSSAPAGAVDWLTQRCSSGSMRAEVRGGVALRLVGRLDCRQRVPGATFSIAHFNPEPGPGLVDMNKLRPYARTAPTRFDLTNGVSLAGTYVLCLVTSLRVRLSCVAFTAVGEGGPLPIDDVRRIAPRDPLIRSRGLDLAMSAEPYCNTCW
jgi:hypothetical protein